MVARPLTSQFNEGVHWRRYDGRNRVGSPIPTRLQKVAQDTPFQDHERSGSIDKKTLPGRVQWTAQAEGLRLAHGCQNRQQTIRKD